MEQNKFYELFMERFMEWFEQQETKAQIELIEGELGYSYDQHEMYDPDEDTDVNLQNIAEDMGGTIWYNAMYDNGHYADKDRPFDFDLYECVKDILTEVADMDWEFSEWLVEDYAYYMLDMRSDPASFFEDLQQGGCQSGMIGGLIYNDEIKQTYIKYLEYMDQYIAELEQEVGPFTEWCKSSLPRYTLVVWTVYEEFAYRIYNELFEN